MIIEILTCIGILALLKKPVKAETITTEEGLISINRPPEEIGELISINRPPEEINGTIGTDVNLALYAEQKEALQTFEAKRAAALKLLYENLPNSFFDSPVSNFMIGKGVTLLNAVIGELTGRAFDAGYSILSVAKPFDSGYAYKTAWAGYLGSLPVLSFVMPLIDSLMGGQAHNHPSGEVQLTYMQIYEAGYNRYKSLKAAFPKFTDYEIYKKAIEFGLFPVQDVRYMEAEDYLDIGGMGQFMSGGEGAAFMGPSIMATGGLTTIFTNLEFYWINNFWAESGRGGSPPPGQGEGNAGGFTLQPAEIMSNFDRGLGPAYEDNVAYYSIGVCDPYSLSGAPPRPAPPPNPYAYATEEDMTQFYRNMV